MRRFTHRFMTLAALVSVVALLGTSARAGAAKAHPDLRDALKEANRRGKVLLVDFAAFAGVGEGEHLHRDQIDQAAERVVQMRRTGADREAINVLRDEAVVWRDGSLGCPKPGMMYTQALVEGYWVVLEHDGKTYDYRAGNRGYFVLCDQPLSLQADPFDGGEGEVPNQ